MSGDVRSTPLPVPAFRNLEIADPARRSNVLGVVRYAQRHRGPHRENGYPELAVHMVSDTADGFTEVWQTERAVDHGERDGVVYAHDGEYFFCAGRIEESGTYTAGVRSAYLTALGLARSLGYGRIFRMWNFVNDINNDNADGMEVYQDFCRGRAQAFDQAGIPEDQLPAATGIGSLGGGIAFYFLACCCCRCVNIENTRQMPAYHYPRRYGPRSPRFTRATHLLPAGADECSAHLYVSGTASIIEHRTVHHGRVDSQCREALANIEHVISADNLAAHGVHPGRRLADLHNVKVYVRHRRDMDTVREICAKSLDPAAEVVFLNVDVCRSDLLVEIEGIVLG
jgi:chorismatase